MSGLTIVRDGTVCPWGKTSTESGVLFATYRSPFESTAMPFGTVMPCVSVTLGDVLPAEYSCTFAPQVVLETCTAFRHASSARPVGDVSPSPICPICGTPTLSRS